MVAQTFQCILSKRIEDLAVDDIKHIQEVQSDKFSDANFRWSFILQYIALVMYCIRSETSFRVGFRIRTYLPCITPFNRHRSDPPYPRQGHSDALPVKNYYPDKGDTAGV